MQRAAVLLSLLVTSSAVLAAEERTLFQSDMTLMAGMTPRDPMAGVPLPRWQWMTMGVGRLQYNHQDGPSGDWAVESPNWLMGMGQRDVGPGRLTLMLMMSVEPLTLKDAGSPQLFQAGETFEGRPLVDYQHPHDLFMNLSATWRAPLGGRGAWWIQLAPRGEPALGPTAFMHRASAGENPAAVLGHHFQDATHITDSVITVGVGRDRVTLEGSVFHGEEPDEDRWDLDPGPLDSASARLKADLGGGWTAQVSHGYLADPEALEEGDVRRTTASLHYKERGEGPFAASLVWGRSREDHGDFDGWLVEGAWQVTGVDQFYGRAEQVDRDLHLLVEKAAVEDHEHPGAGHEENIVAVRAFTFGYLRELKKFSPVRWLDEVAVGLGGDVTLFDYPLSLTGAYGDSPLGVHAFLRLRWGRPHGAGHGAHAVHHGS
jgi:hypothetical protein